VIPSHPVAGPDPRTLRWIVPAGTLPLAGPARAVPAPLQELRGDGTVAAIDVADGHVDVTLGAGREWSREGGRVRTALLAALERADEWRTGEGAGGARPSLDARLYDATAAALAGEVGELARSHGGAIELDSVQDGVVTVRMQGACHGCPAAGLTLHARLERLLRDACPDLREVRSVEPVGGRTRAVEWLQRIRPRP
jgi:Fe-S cluster biogenesis protein NfuA